MTKTELLTGLIYNQDTNILLQTKTFSHFLFSEISFKKMKHTNKRLSYQFPIKCNLSFCFISMWGRALRRGPWPAVTLAELLFVEAICCIHRQRGESPSLSWLSDDQIPALTLSDIRRSSVACVRGCCTCAHMLCVILVSRCTVVPKQCPHMQPVVCVCVVASLADMRKGQGCHLVPHGWLLRRVGCAATKDKVKESSGRWQVVSYPDRAERAHVIFSQNM